MAAAMGDTDSEKSTTAGHRNERIAKIEDVDVAAALDSDKPLEPEVAANLRSVVEILSSRM
jgi:hypothetical protein